MKPHLKRIDTNQHQLAHFSTSSYPEPAASENRTDSFEICTAAQEHNDLARANSDATAQTLPGKTPTLPKFKSLSFSSGLNSPNSGLEMNPVKEIQTDVASCEAELQQIVRQIQDLYLEGPIVDGWLESHPSEGYRLCGLDPAGNMWFRPCPQEQLPSVSIAIARYQKLLQLLERKHYIENRLDSSLDETNA